jgi:hypothetical protein
MPMRFHHRQSIKYSRFGMIEPVRLTKVLDAPDCRALAGKGIYHHGPDLASSYTTVDGWSCQFQMGSSGCTFDGKHITGQFAG